MSVFALLLACNADVDGTLLAETTWDAVFVDERGVFAEATFEWHQNVDGTWSGTQDYRHTAWPLTGSEAFYEMEAELIDGALVVEETAMFDEVDVVDPYAASMGAFGVWCTGEFVLEAQTPESDLLVGDYWPLSGDCGNDGWLELTIVD